MFKQKHASQIPAIVPLLKPLAPPEHIINLCLQHQQNSKKQSNPKNKTLAIIEEQNFKTLFEQKCQELAHQITKSRQYEQTVTALQFRNNQLQSQIWRMQEERWNGYDYSRLSARGRSKSQKRVVPIVQVKIPATDHHFTFAQGNQNKFMATERQSFQRKISQYQREIHEFRLQIKQLKAKIKEAEQKYLQNHRSTKQNNASSEQQLKKQEKGQSQHSGSPLKYAFSQGRVQKLKTPQVAEFSPDLNYHIETVKKDQNYAQSAQHQIKKLRNELLYKDLLINRLKQQKQKESHILHRHLLLSVHQSKKMAEETTLILEKFKNQIIVLWKQLQAQKSKNLNFKSQFQKQYLIQTQQKQLKGNELQSHNKNLLQLLKARRSQNFQ